MFPLFSSKSKAHLLQSFYDFKALNLREEEVSMEKYRGKVVLIVNVASLCGLTTSNYSQLSDIYSRLHDQGFEILAFPCNQFGSQEPGNADSIEETCGRFKVGFDLFDKIDVNGSGAHPLYVWLKNSLPGVLIDGIKWNFTKFLLDRDGKPVARFGPQEDPKSFENQIVELLKKPATEVSKPAEESKPAVESQ